MVRVAVRNRDRSALLSANANSHTDGYADFNAEYDTHSDSYPHANANSHTDGYAEYGTHSDSYPHANANSHTDGYAEYGTHSDSYPHANAANTFINSFADTDFGVIRVFCARVVGAGLSGRGRAPLGRGGRRPTL